MSCGGPQACSNFYLATKVKRINQPPTNTSQRINTLASQSCPLTTNLVSRKPKPLALLMRSITEEPTSTISSTWKVFKALRKRKLETPPLISDGTLRTHRPRKSRKFRKLAQGVMSLNPTPPDLEQQFRHISDQGTAFITPNSGLTSATTDEVTRFGHQFAEKQEKTR